MFDPSACGKTVFTWLGADRVCSDGWRLWRMKKRHYPALRRKKPWWPVLSTGSWYANISTLDLSSPPPSPRSPLRIISLLVYLLQPVTVTPFPISSRSFPLTHSPYLLNPYILIFHFSFFIPVVLYTFIMGYCSKYSTDRYLLSVHVRPLHRITLTSQRSCFHSSHLATAGLTQMFPMIHVVVLFHLGHRESTCCFVPGGSPETFWHTSPWYIQWIAPVSIGNV